MVELVDVFVGLWRAFVREGEVMYSERGPQAS